MKKYDLRLRAEHVLMDGDHLKLVLAQDFEHRIDFTLQHRHVARYGRVLICANEGSPRIEAHARIDSRTHLADLEILPANGEFDDGSRLFMFMPNNLVQVFEVQLPFDHLNRLAWLF